MLTDFLSYPSNGDLPKEAPTATSLIPSIPLFPSTPPKKTTHPAGTRARPITPIRNAPAPSPSPRLAGPWSWMSPSPATHTGASAPCPIPMPPALLPHRFCRCSACGSATTRVEGAYSVLWVVVQRSGCRGLGGSTHGVVGDKLKNVWFFCFHPHP